jgi:hypothetical protein
METEEFPPPTTTKVIKKNTQGLLVAIMTLIY